MVLNNFFDYILEPFRHKAYVGAAALVGVMSGIKTFQMEIILSLDWAVAAQMAKVLVLAVITGYLGGVGKNLADKHFKKKKE